MTYRKKGEIVTRSIAGETILVPIRAKLADMEQLIVIDGIADFIWDRIDGRTEMDTILAAIVGDFNVEKETARKDMEDFVSGLLKADLIEVVA